MVPSSLIKIALENAVVIWQENNLQSQESEKKSGMS